MTHSTRAESIGHAGLPIPPKKMRFMGESDEDFIPIAVDLANWLRNEGMPDDARLLDVGSGYGRLAVGLLASGFTGDYLGFDILRRPVRWSRRNLADRGAPGQRIRFKHVDARNARYNPEGLVDPAEVRFPARDASHDWGVLLSVFTHMYADNIRHYLAELHRTIRPGGHVLTTCFTWSSDRLAQLQEASRCEFPLVHELDQHTRYANPDDPLHVIAYEETYLQGLIRESGLEVERFQLGAWSGAASSQGQDWFVLRRP